MIHVLLVDDDPGLFNITKILLEKNGELMVDLCSSVPDAMGMLKARSYAAIISDYDMPVLNGIEFFKKLRQNNCDIPFIIFTGKGGEDTAIQALNCGIDYYVKKGRDPEMVFSELRSAVMDVTKERTMQSSNQTVTISGKVILTDLDGIITYADRSLEDLLHIPECSMQSRSLFDFIAPHSRDRVQDILLLSRREKFSADEDGVYPVDIDLVTGEGSILKIEFFIRHVPASPGHPAVLLLVESIPCQ